MSISGIWIPLVTPFRDGKVDVVSIRKLVDHFIDNSVAGLLPLGTTGESPTLEDAEFDLVVDEIVSRVAGRVPVIVGVGGSGTDKVAKLIRRFDQRNIDGFLVVAPYYNRPSQDGLRQHFSHLAELTAKKIIVYNIPYRTGVNIQNDLLLELAHQKNIVAVKDCCANISQTLDLLARKPQGFSVLAGDDYLFYTLLANGADGGILASAHINTDVYMQVFQLMRENNFREAYARWNTIAPFAQLLFQEPNPGPVKYCLWKQGLIASPECRLPMTTISDGLKKQLDLAMKIS